MKIFFCSQSFYPHIGGVSTYLLKLTRSLQERGHEVTVVHLRPIGEEIEEEIKGIKVHRVPKVPLNSEFLKGYYDFKEKIYKECHGYGTYFKKEAIDIEGFNEYQEINSAFIEQLEELLEKHPAELIHVHDFQVLYLYKGVPRGVPLILTWHIPFIPTISKHLKDFLIKHMSQYDKVIFSSKEYAETAVKAGLPAEKAEVIYPITNTDFFKPMDIKKDSRGKYGIPKDKKIILCVQRIDAKSGHLQLVRAMPKIIEAVPDARLVFVGGKSLSTKISNEREKYENEVNDLIKQLKITDYVHFTGYVEQKDIPLIYNMADVVALTSKFEAFGLSVTEGMACGKPIIGTRVGGISIQVKDGVNGYLVDVDDIDATAEKISELLLNEDLRRRMGKESLKIVKENFVADIAIEKHVQLYHELLQEKSESWSLEMIKLEDVSTLITDFDRTLTDEPGKVKEKVIKKLKSLKKPLILVTGRKLSFVKKFSKKYPIWDCMVAENGAVVYFPKKEQTIITKSPYITKAKEIIKNSGIDATFGNVIVSTSLTNRRKIKRLLEGINKYLNYKINVDEIMVLPQNVDKGSGTKLALNILEIDPEKTIIIGDAENDIDLFNIPGFRVAVANAHENLKSIADQVTENPSSDGIIEVVNKLKK